MTVGAQLRQARQERKLSLADVTRETKIQPWVLEAIEGDRLHEIMSPVYVKGFLTTYAKFLHVAPEPLATQVLATPPPAPSVPEPEPLPPVVRTLPQVSLPQWHLPKWKMPQLTMPRLAMPRIEMPRLQMVRWKIPPLVQQRLIQVAAMSLVIGAVVVVNPLRWLSKIQWPTLRMPKLASITPVGKPDAPPKPQTIALAPAQSLELVVNAHRTTWIQIKADGKLLTQQRLPRGSNERWVAKKRFELIIAKPSQVEVVLNGQSIDPFAIAHQGRLLITHRGVTPLPESE